MNNKEFSPSGYRPLNVKDSLSYLDQVKTKFSDQPDIFQHFLDIMKEFKSQTLDTMGVIDRITTLFKGQASLITGFNRFLPPGYHLEYLPDRIRITSPSGTRVKPSDERQAIHEAIDFLQRVRTRHPDRYQTFLQLLERPGDRSNMTGLIEPDLLQDFRRLVLPDTTGGGFFERVKRHIGTRATYFEFLKVLHLFSQQVLDGYGLMEQVGSFLNEELMEELRGLVIGVRSRPIEGLPLVELEPGSSYRSVPESWKRQSCSGRDALCWEVLNDEYISHPTWASEDSGFIASKKNQFEEALHRIEDERYEYDLNLDANLNTIELLTGLEKKMAVMTADQKRSFRFVPGMDGTSESIYQSCLKRVYGEVLVGEMIEVLHSDPVHSIPVILKRLEEKAEEWKKEQGEWNKVWREIEIKNYYKSLDYQGVSFKSNDRKIISNRYLANQIEAMRIDQLHETNSILPQFMFDFKDQAVFQDVTRLINLYFDYQTLYSQDESNAIKGFLETFIPIFFHLQEESSIEFNECLLDDAMRRTHRRLTRHQKNKQEEIYLDEKLNSREHKIHNIFSNTTLYCFFRLYQLCYERLYSMKQVSKERKNDGERTKKINRSALELNITTPVYHSIESDFKEEGYLALFRILDRLFANEIDQNVYEECTRYLFGTKAYVLFTFDKLIPALVRQLYHVVTDIKSQEVLGYFKKYQENEKSTSELIQIYRLQATETLGENENLYHIMFDSSRQTLSIQLLEKEDETFEMDSDRYNEYITQFTHWDMETPHLKRKHISRPFLTRNLNLTEELQESDLIINSNLQYKICKNTYHMFYVIHTEDSFINERKKRKENIQEKNDAFKSWLKKKESLYEAEESSLYLKNKNKKKKKL